MRKSTLGALALAALAAGASMTSCVGEKNDTPKPNLNDKKIEVTVALDQPQQKVRAYGPSIEGGLVVEIMNGYLIFADKDGLATKIFPLLRKAVGQPLTVDGGTVNSDQTITLRNVPATSAELYVVTNFNDTDAATKPMTGESVSGINPRFTSLLDLNRVSDAKHMPAHGRADLLDDAEANKKKAAVTLNGDAARVQINHFGLTDVSAIIEGLYLNKIDTKFNGGWLDNASDAALYVGGSERYPTSMKGLTHDTPITTEVKGPNINLIVGSGVYGYNLIYSGNGAALPQIIVKLTDVKIHSLDGRTTSLPDPQFVTVTGFRDKSGNKIAAFESSMVYTIDEIEIASSRLTPRPNMKPVDVTVTIVPVTWSETKVDPEY